MRSLSRGVLRCSALQRPSLVWLALVLTLTLLMLARSNSVLAHTNGHSVPPHIGANSVRDSGSASAAGHSRDSRGHDNSKPDRKPSASQQRPAISPEQAAQRARNRFGGRVLNVVLEHGAGGPYYRVKLLEHGRVRVVDIDARR